METQAAVPQQQKGQTFFEMIRNKPRLCWEELVEEFRRDYYDAFDEIVPILFATNDPLIIFNCIQFADLNEPKEVAILQQFIRDCDAEKHQVSLRFLAEKQEPEFLTTLRQKQALPASVQEVLA